MTKPRLFRLWLVLGSALMILLIIVYWDNVGTAHFNLHTSLSRPHILEPLPTQGLVEENVFTSDVDEFLDTLLSSDAKHNDLSRRKLSSPRCPPPASQS